MDSPTMTETEQKIKASAQKESVTAPVEEKKVEEKPIDEVEEEEELEEDFEEEIIERSGEFYDEQQDSLQIEDSIQTEESSVEEDEKIEEKNEVDEEETQEFHLANESYIKSFENRTIDDILREKREEEQVQPEQKVTDTRSLKEYFEDLRRAKAQESEKDEQKEVETENEPQSETVQEESLSVVEKPNYDLIQTDKKIIKITQKKKKKEKKRSKKVASIAIAIALAFTGGICITNSVLIDQQYSAYVEIGDTYELNLSKYLKNISNLDATKQSMEVVETYPEEVNEAGDLGEYSNWFDRICNFLSGLFGG